MSFEPREAGTVPVRVQVVDMEPRVVDPTVPNYLETDDLTQRIARDVGLGGWWEDGSRRGFGLWARGRLMGGEERLNEAGVVPYELLHLLPEPRRGVGVQERPLGADERGDPPSTATKFMRTLAVLLWVPLWTVALSVRPSAPVAWLGAFGLSFLALGAVRGFIWGRPSAGWGRTAVWPALWTAAVVMLAGSAPLGVGIVAAAPEERITVGLLVVLGAISGGFGAWLTWLGPLALTERPTVKQAAAQLMAQLSCGICGTGVAETMHEPCPYGCGRSFHRGCWQAKVALASGPGCAACGVDVGR